MKAFYEKSFVIEVCGKKISFFDGTIADRFGI
jgi:hypothetical protein